MKVVAKGYKISFGGDENILKFSHSVVSDALCSHGL